MSLVNEALKKARLEAARQDAARRGIPLPGVERPTRRPIGAAALFKAGLAALVVAAGVLIFFAGRSSSSDPASAPAPAATATEAARIDTGRPHAAGSAPAETARIDTGPPATPRSAPAPDPIELPRDGSAPVAGEAVARAPRAAPAEVAENDRPPAAPSREDAAEAAARPRQARAERPPAIAQAPPPAPEPEATGESAPRRALPAAADPLPDEGASPALRTAVRQLELPGSRKIELGGIAWSEERPFALINGRVVGPGDQVETLTVVSIEQRHVELRGREGHFLLRLK